MRRPINKLETARAEMLAAIKAEDWSGLGVTHLVGLYDVAHEGTYKVRPSDVDDRTFAAAEVPVRLDVVFHADEVTKRHPQIAQDFLADLLRRTLKRLAEHEIDEMIQVDGRRVFDPHARRWVLEAEDLAT